MDFTSLSFIIFFLISFVLFYSFPMKLRPIVLFFFSSVFIGSFSIQFLFYSYLFIAVNYSVGRLIGYSSKYRKQIYIIGQLFNIGGLIIYKYIDFIIENVNFFFHIVDSKYSIPYLDILIPLGISYYTFQGISYLYMIYKTHEKPERDFINFSIYVIYFPKILAGPIERHRAFLPQLKNKLVFNYGNIIEGGRLILSGLFKKVVLGDCLALLVNKVYVNPESFDGQVLILTFLLQPIQIYFDFSGYTDIAIGLSKIFGINLSQNFNRPFFSRTMAEFWRRWHMSLSSWCNDYIYNRMLLKYRKLGNRAVLYSILITFIVIGVWHGAKWTYVIVGILQVIALSYEFFTKKWRLALVKRYPEGMVKWFSRLMVYLFICFFMTFFFARDVNDAFVFFYKMFSIEDLTKMSFGVNMIKEEFFFVILITLLYFVWEYKVEEKKIKVQSWLKIHQVFRWGLYFIAIFLIVYFSKNESVFVYEAF